MTHARGSIFVVLAISIAVALGVQAQDARGSELVDRIVAIVGDRAITRYQVRRRLVPFAKKIEQAESDKVKRQVMLDTAEQELLQRMIDERLIENAAADKRIAVTPDEVDAGLLAIANANHTTLPQLLNDALAFGLNAADYRAEIRRQILVAKVVRAANADAWNAAQSLPEADRFREQERIEKEWVASLRNGVRVETRL